MGPPGSEKESQNPYPSQPLPSLAKEKALRRCELLGGCSCRVETTPCRSDVTSLRGRAVGSGVMVALWNAGDNGTRVRGVAMRTK